MTKYETDSLMPQEKADPKVSEIVEEIFHHGSVDDTTDNISYTAPNGDIYELQYTGMSFCKSNIEAPSNVIDDTLPDEQQKILTNANNGNIEAQVKLAEYYLSLDTNDGYAKAVNCLITPVEANHLPATIFFGQLLTVGKGIKKDIHKAIEKLILSMGIGCKAGFFVRSNFFQGNH